MSTTKRQQIINALDARLKAILTTGTYTLPSGVTGNYNTNIGSNVAAWREEAYSLTELPAVEYRDNDDTRDFSLGEDLHILSIDLRILSTSITEIRAALADIEVAIGIDQNFGNLAEETSILSDSIEVHQGDQYLVSSTVKIQIQYLTVNFDPYH